MNNTFRFDRWHAFRMGLLQLVALALATGCVVTAPRAQTEPMRAPNYAETDPPGRVGKISLLSGQVTLTDARSGDTEEATLNWPITSGHRLATDAVGRAEVRIGSVAVRLDADTVVDFSRIDDDAMQIVVQRGTVALRLRNRELLRELDVVTPRERLVFDDVGRYRIDVDRTPMTTAVTAFVGAARISSGRNTFSVTSGQRGELATMPGLSFRLVGPARDVFDDWVLARDQRDDAVRSAQYVSRETTGVEALDAYGAWRVVPEYGTVWFPSAVPTGWAPYRYGRWAYVAPWGWTWVDAAPWGFAPFHYGRWVVVGGVWGWYPGVIVARPIYSPALVVWYGTPGLSINVSIGPTIGWFPLGPREVYIPPYHHSRRYIQSVNIQHVTNINYITVVNPPPRYVHQQPGRSTWAPNDAIVRQRPINRVVVQPPTEQQVKLSPVTRPAVVVPDDFNKRRILPGTGPADGTIARPQPRGVTVVPQPADSGRVRTLPPASPETGPGRARLEPPVVAPAPRGMIEAPVDRGRVRTLPATPVPESGRGKLEVAPVAPAPRVDVPPPAIVRPAPRGTAPATVEAPPPRRPQVEPPLAPDTSSPPQYAPKPPAAAPRVVTPPVVTGSAPTRIAPAPRDRGPAILEAPARGGEDSRPVQSRSKIGPRES